MDEIEYDFNFDKKFASYLNFLPLISFPIKFIYSKVYILFMFRKSSAFINSLFGKKEKMLVLKKLVSNFKG